jgi:hypothetical protein
MSRKSEVGVCCVFHSEVCCKVIEATIMGYPNECYALQELLSLLWGDRAAINVRKAIFPLWKSNLYPSTSRNEYAYDFGEHSSDPFVAGHNVIIVYWRRIWLNFFAPKFITIYFSIIERTLDGSTYGLLVLCWGVSPLCLIIHSHGYILICPSSFPCSGPTYNQISGTWIVGIIITS